MKTERKTSHPTMPGKNVDVRITLDYEWREIGAVRVEAGKIRFPDAPEVPGIYRFDLDDKVYIGEAERLRRRFQHYRTPGLTQPTNIRLNSVIMRLLDGPGTMTVSTITSAEIEVEGERSALDLRQKAARLLVDSVALTAAQLRGHAVENL
jgi:hypothetical protein